MRVLTVWILAVLGVLVLVFGLVGLPLYVFPHSDRPAHADAVVILGPPFADRRSDAQRLVAQGLAGHVYISVPSDQLAHTYCLDADVTCFHPTPFTTRGEALFTHRQAQKHGWKRVLVITAQYHTTRARYIFDQCVPGTQTRLVASHERLSPRNWVYQYLYQTAAFGKAVLLGCAD
ncbi:MAG TPA: ElyC/SanA/YdcF family protein [Gryllotalpicola sp.]